MKNEPKQSAFDKIREINNNFKGDNSPMMNAILELDSRLSELESRLGSFSDAIEILEQANKGKSNEH